MIGSLHFKLRAIPGRNASCARLRRFLSRFVVVVVVALAVESLITVFQFAHEAPEHLPYAASIAVAAALLLAAWGVFVQLNLGAQALEPEEMAAAAYEDADVKRKEGGGAVALRCRQSQGP